MLNFLAMIYSVPFIIGAIVGCVGMRVYCRARAVWEDVHHPLPDGSHHVVGGISSTWIAGLITVTTFGYVLMQAERAHDYTVTLARDVVRCQAQFNQAVLDRDKISSENDALSYRHRDLRDQLDGTYSDWIHTIIDPPTDIAVLGFNDPRRESWTVAATRVYGIRVREIRDQIAAVDHQQDRLEEYRRHHPLPELTCGR